MQEEFRKYQDAHSAAYFSYLGASRWFAFWLDFATAVYASVIILFCFSLEQMGKTIRLNSSLFVNLDIRENILVFRYAFGWPCNFIRDYPDCFSVSGGCEFC